MTTYESDIKTISSSEEVVFNQLSDLNNLKKLQELNLGEKSEYADKLKDMEFDSDSVFFNVDGFGRVGMRVIEREPYKTIKFQSENVPVNANVWVQLKQVAENDTRMKLTLKADIPMMIKMMVDKKLKEGINMIADVIAKAIAP
ncbi:MAG: SRPBCC family protein [Paludibacteraceae bacterium]